jgi:hypothetical protein
MRVMRNVALLVFVAVVAFSVRVAQAEDDFCPPGCSCDWEGNMVSVSCWQVADCDSLYPSFCEDFQTACLNYCGYGYLAGMGCGSVGGACEGSCTCTWSGR